MEKQSKRTITNITIRIIVILVLLICLQYILTIMNTENRTIGLSKLFYSTVSANTSEDSNRTKSQEDPNEGEYLRLTDLQWRSESNAGWDRLRINEDNNGAKLSVKREGNYYTFDNGIWAHASSNIYYNISEYSEKYHYLIMYVGINKTSSSGNGVKFFIYTSNNENFVATGEQNWTCLSDSERVYMPGQDAVYMKIDISGAKYLRLQAYHNGSNASDHSVYIDPMLITDNYKEEEQKLPSIEEYDEKIKAYIKAYKEEHKNDEDYDESKALEDPDFELLVLQRELISRVGNYALGRFLSESEENKETYEWLTGDVETLRLYLVGGLPEGGSYLNSLNVLTKLYTAHKDDLSDETEIEITIPSRKEKTTLGKLYRKMMLSISLTHSGKVYLWITGSNVSDPVKRYEIYKKLYLENLIETKIFESLTVEEMRWVMNTIIDDEEIEWLNWYVRENRKGNTDPYNYIKYTLNYNYWQAKYWDKSINKEQIEAWEQSYGLSRFGIEPKQGNPKLWIVIREGAVCGGISKTGCCIWGSYKGLPNTCVSQPAHCAYLTYSQNANGYGTWSLGNDISGWAKTGKTEHLNTRMPNDWGKGNYTSGYNACYILLAQAAQNEYKKYEKAEEILMLANVYSNDKEELDQIYDEALEAEAINFDAWLGKVNLYKSDNTKTDEDYYKLAEDIATNLTYYPRPMYDLLKLIEPNIKTPAYYAQFNMLRTQTLTKASKATNATFLQGNAAKQVANSLLGSYDQNIANFSFDGANGGAIVLGSKFEASEARWEYSLDGGENWTATSEKLVKLSNEELESITSTNDIKVHIIGVARSEKNIYTIDIQESAGLPSNLFANDLENRVIGVDLGTEWRYTENDAWTSYSVASPDLTGNKTVQVRQGATGVRLASNASSIYTFTEDNQQDTRKYIPVTHLEVVGYLSQSKDSKRPFYAPNAIDGNANTLWHTDFAVNVLQGTEKPYFTIKLDSPRHISALEFMQKKYPGKPNDPDDIKNAIVYVSEDGENWTEAGRIENCPNPYKENELRKIEFNKSIYGQYVKIEMETYNMFASLAMVNLFEDTTKITNTVPTAGIAYSTTESTNEPVIARIINPSTEITITNNDGKDTYIFTDNGEFTFKFVDSNGVEGSVTAKIDWIDKDIPTADVTYRLGDNQKLIAILSNISEDVYLLDKNDNKTNYVEVEDGKVVSISFLDESGNTYKIAEVDENMVTTQISYKNTIGKVTNVSNYITVLQNGEIVERIAFDNDGNSVELTEEEIEDLKELEGVRSNPLEYYLEEDSEYEFKLLDKASNITYKNVKVDYIDNNTKILASDITYSTTSLTNQDVVATINPYVIDMEGRNCNVTIIGENSNNNSTNLLSGAIGNGIKLLTNNENQKVVAEHTFTENGKYTFRYSETKINETDVDKEEKSHTAEVTWIDKDAPTAQIQYSTQDTTNEAVVATLVDESEDIVITNNGSSREYTFNENGKFVFKFIDKAGNEGTVEAVVNWIKKDDDEFVFESNNYTIEEGFISKIKPGTYTEAGTTVKEFKDNITTNQELKFLDKNGKVLTDTDVIKTGMKLKVGEELEYTLLVTGDVDEDGKITINDLVRLKLHCIRSEILTPEKVKTADFNNDGEVTINDVVRLKLMLIGKTV